MFERAVAITLDLEGRDSNRDPKDDPGGYTRFGFAQKFNPDIDVRKLTLEEAKERYRARYWNVCRCGEMPWPVALAVWDFAVNSGPSDAAKALQLSLGGLVVDGVIGPQTIGRVSVRSKDAGMLVDRIQTERVMHMMRLPNWDANKIGWLRRTHRIARECGSYPD
jgi:lysozyme family protein